MRATILISGTRQKLKTSAIVALCLGSACIGIVVGVLFYYQFNSTARLQNTSTTGNGLQSSINQSHAVTQPQDGIQLPNATHSNYGNDPVAVPQPIHESESKPIDEQVSQNGTKPVEKWLSVVLDCFNSNGNKHSLSCYVCELYFIHCYPSSLH